MCNNNKKDWNSTITGNVNIGEVIHIRDVNSKDIFRNNVLTCQFLKDYTGISLFSDLEPDDLEDQTEKFRFKLGIEIEGDTIKKVRLRSKEYHGEIYVITLIEHKSSVDYDVAMQLLMYMTVIWRDFAEKANKQKKDANKTKYFRYPLIFPIVYYEGTDRWTADMHLSDRIEFAEIAKECIPEFTYKVVPLRDYGREDFQQYNNEMSLVMMINKIQKPEDFAEFRKNAKDFFESVYKHTSADVQDLIIRVLWGLLMKMKVPVDEAADMLRSVKEEENMGILFD